MLRLLNMGLHILAALFCLCPVRRRVAFLSRQGTTVSTDFRMLLDKLHELDPSLPTIVRTSEPEQGGMIQLAWHLIDQLRYATTSRVVVLDGYNPVVCIPHKRRDIYVIQLWHSAGAIKKFGYQCLDTPAGRPRAFANLAHMHKNYDVIVAGGAGAQEAYAQAFGYTREQVLPLGIPRFDHLLQVTYGCKLRLKLIDENPWLANGKLNVVYAPTMRKERTSDKWLSCSIAALAHAFAELPVNLIVSKHPLTHTIVSTANLPACAHAIPTYDTESLLWVADIVVSDYSAIALEAGLIGIPVIFFVPDIDTYCVSPGLNVNVCAEPGLYATKDAQSLVYILSDNDRVQQLAHDYQEFISRYFEGLEPGATSRIAALILDHLSTSTDI